MGRELSVILQDNRLVTLEDIVKNASSLPPILMSPAKRGKLVNHYLNPPLGRNPKARPPIYKGNNSPQ